MLSYAQPIDWVNAMMNLIKLFAVKVLIFTGFLTPPTRNFRNDLGVLLLKLVR